MFTFGRAAWALAALGIDPKLGLPAFRLWILAAIHFTEFQYPNFNRYLHLRVLQYLLWAVLLPGLCQELIRIYRLRENLHCQTLPPFEIE